MLTPTNPDIPAPRIAIIGGGPAGLMAAEVCAAAGREVHLFDAMPSPGRKLLLAGKGGLNITHSEALEVFLSRYGEHRKELEPFICRFGPAHLRDWALGLGVDTFVGSSGKVFPEGMKAAPLLRHWLQRLRSQGVHIHVRHRWLGHCAATPAWQLRLDTPQGIRQDLFSAVILAVGGASWPKLGSDGSWVPILQNEGVPISPLLPSNCGFEVSWSEHFRSRFAGEALKNIAACVSTPEGNSSQRRGECLVSATGLEGSLIYALGAALRQELLRTGRAALSLDLMPDRSLEWLQQQIAHPRGARSMASHLQSRLGLKGVKAGILRECCNAETYKDATQLANTIKNLSIPLQGMRPLAEAISSAGGVKFAALDDRLMLCNQPGIFCAGEMLDWDAPTGGYLLTACMATGRAAGQSALQWLAQAQV